MIPRLLITTVLFSAYMLTACAGFVEPTNEQIRREFVSQNPETIIVKYTKTFEEVAVAVYEVEYKAKDSEEIKKRNIMLHQCVHLDWKADYRQCN